MSISSRRSRTRSHATRPAPAGAARSTSSVMAARGPQPSSHTTGSKPLWVLSRSDSAGSTDPFGDRPAASWWLSSHHLLFLAGRSRRIGHDGPDGDGSVVLFGDQ